MSEAELGIVILIVTTVVLLSGLPIAFGLTIVAVSFLVLFEGFASLSFVARTFLTELSSFAILAVPMFVLLGAIIGTTRAGVDIYEALNRWLSRVPGGLVIANIGACGLFSALCGSSPATAAAIGKVGVPEMMKRGVRPSLATGAIAAGGTLGILIPPSVTMILYGIVTETSIGRLFMAGVIPGLLLVLIFALYAWVTTVREERPVTTEERRYDLREKLQATVQVLPLVGIILLIIFALYGGYATPSEIAAVAALLAFIYVALRYGLTRRGIVEVFGPTVRESCMILLIIAAAGLFSYMLSLLYVTQTAAENLVALDLNRWVLLAIINVFLLVAGCFLPPVALILMTMPILQPVLLANDFDMIWFGVLMTINLEIGLITPPVGLNLFVLRGVAPQVPLGQILKGSVPFVFLMIGFMVLLCFLPGLALWLPNLMHGS